MTKQVETKEGIKLSKRIGAARALECSALNNSNVHQIFEAAVCAALKISITEPSSESFFSCAVL